MMAIAMVKSKCTEHRIKYPKSGSSGNDIHNTKHFDKKA